MFPEMVAPWTTNKPNGAIFNYSASQQALGSFDTNADYNNYVGGGAGRYDAFGGQLINGANGLTGGGSSGTASTAVYGGNSYRDGGTTATFTGGTSTNQNGSAGAGFLGNASSSTAGSGGGGGAGQYSTNAGGAGAAGCMLIYY
jgi:hypothetical protein